MDYQPPERLSRKPITTVAELIKLDPEEIMAGYREGVAGEPEPGDNRSFSFWHGWRNGHNDRHGKSDNEAAALVRDCLKNDKLLAESRFGLLLSQLAERGLRVH